MSTKVYAELAGSVATVAIASLGGPVWAASATLTAIVRHAQSAYLSREETRDLHRQVQSAVETWATMSGELTREQTGLGLALAAQIIARHGASREAIAELNFDADDASSEVLAAARSEHLARRFAHESLSSWGAEPHFDVAERAVKETYSALVRQLRNKSSSVFDAVIEVRRSLDDVVRRLDEELGGIREAGWATTAELNRLVGALIESAVGRH